ncbi:platelet glycoprotein Ib alpha chain [Anguilla anguilla]|uniref:platelet glycoprotein Ib alpha chain n=1 Tax=Anguilla anguilla TaxID=7936 RepID=UPI0015AE7CD9|nr:platelet glycoprotein Ib alpha chain [Anguilla anguilla]
MRFTVSLLILYNLYLTMTSCCRSDRNPDNRPRVNCTGMTLSNVPPAIDPATEVIVLTDNEFASLSWTSYQSFHKLHELDLSRNKVSSLENIPDLILPSLSILRLSGNRLQELPASAFVAASKLMEIFLRANQLRTLNEETFKDLEKLEVLDLSQNLIQVLPLSLLAVINTKFLKTFDVEDNRLKVMPDEFFSKLPDIPYVYLSKNLWVCNCKVAYLSRWLEDQGHNVYVHTGPSNIVNDPESVVCDSPSSLKDRAIIDLQEDEYCPPSPLGDMDSTGAPAAISRTESFQSTASPSTTAAIRRILSTAYIPSSTQTAAATQTTTIIPNQAKTTTTPTIIQTTTSTQTSPNTHTFIRTTTPTQPHTTGYTFWFVTAITSYYRTWTGYKYYVTEFATSKMVAEEGMESEPTTMSTTFQMTTIPTPTPTPTTMSTTFQMTTIPTSTSTSTPTSKPLSTSPSTTEHHQTTTGFPWTTKQSLTVRSVVLDSRIQERPVVYYCWWLFIGYLCLCVLLVFWLCIISLWSLRVYLRVYLPLVRKKQEQRRNTARLLGYHVRQGKDTEGREENAGWRGKVGDQAGTISLPLEGAEGVQALFRSVLFVYKTGEKKEGEGEEGCEAVKSEDTARKDGPTTSQECMISEGIGRIDIGGGGKGEVHRKTLYKVISREEEITGWSDVDMSQKSNEGNQNEQAERVMQGWSERNRRSSELKKRYSLILREERVEGEEWGRSRSREPSIGNEWVVREWMLRDRGGEAAAGDTREEDWWSLMPLIASSTDLEPRGGDSSTTSNDITSETRL